MSADVHGYTRPVADAAVTRVLVIDDEAPIRLLCRVNLEAEGIHVLEAADGTTGLDLARDQQPDVVLLDVMMPGLDGWRVAEELLEDDRTRGIPIIILTARAASPDRARALDLCGVAAGATPVTRPTVRGARRGSGTPRSATSRSATGGRSSSEPSKGSLRTTGRCSPRRSRTRRSSQSLPCCLSSSEPSRSSSARRRFRP